MGKEVKLCYLRMDALLSSLCPSYSYHIVRAVSNYEVENYCKYNCNSVCIQVVRNQGANSIDILNFGRKTGHKTGPSSEPNSILWHNKFRHVSKLQKWHRQGSGPRKMSIELHPCSSCYQGLYRTDDKRCTEHFITSVKRLVWDYSWLLCHQVRQDLAVQKCHFEINTIF